MSERRDTPRAEIQRKRIELLTGPKRPMNFMISPSLFHALKQASTWAGVSQADLIEYALSKMLKENGLKFEQRTEDYLFFLSHGVEQMLKVSPLKDVVHGEEPRSFLDA